MNQVIGIAIRRVEGKTACCRVDAKGKDRSMTPEEAQEYFAGHPTYKGIEAVEIDGQQMVKIPAFYVSSGEHNEDPVFWISPSERRGFHLHPAFLRHGEPAPYFLVGAYEGSLNGGLAMCSLPGMATVGDRSFHDMRTACLARNGGPLGGWDMWNVYQLAALQRLAMIETGSTDSQIVLGRGHVDGGGLELTGKSGLCWRGIHDLWGNSWAMVAGLETDEEHQIFLLDNQGHGTMLPTGIKTPCDGIGFISAMHAESGSYFNLSDIFLPKAVVDNQEEALYPDYFWKSWPGEHNVAYHGGYWGHGSSSGLFTLSLRYPASLSSASIGCRLAKA